jgi:hypothetical protein
MTAPAPGTSAKLLIIGGISAGVGLLIKLILPLTYGKGSYEKEPWQIKNFGAGLVGFLGGPSHVDRGVLGGGIGLADFALILGAAALALAFAVKGFEPRVPRPVAPQGYPQGQYPGQYAQPQPGQYPQGQPAQPGQAQPGQTGQFGQPAAPPSDQGGYPQQQQWGGPAS